MSTNKELNVNVVGSATHAYGEGYSTETLNGNSTHKVDQGKFTLDVSDNIEVATPRNILLTAYDMATVLSGNSDTKVQGDSTTTVEGSSNSYYKQSTSTNQFSTSMTITHGDTTIVKFSASFSISMSISLSLSAAASTSLSLGFNVSVQLGASVKIVAPSNVTLVMGQDYKWVAGSSVQYGLSANKFISGTDSKVSLNDIKTAGIEYKNIYASFSDVMIKDEYDLTREQANELESLKKGTISAFKGVESQMVAMMSIS
ncbi:hypothetical protein [Segnochrobactrum spirostomi]|uniref:Uncharacterized protein n=1 Tax=Segnochrobactrum spirostomi TaxID=2608987 RepID=A0A6A7Y0L4_9HYPH|nr:hypothetical protein [Segnochrobactrum spirostomi]MQT11937.1 hypothetical protein [Segnochrobactrum spirostomi]